MKFSPVHQFFAPQTDMRQFWRSLAILCAPWRYRHGKSLNILEKELTEMYGAPALLFGIATDAMVATLHTLKLQPQDEVIISGYTCSCVRDAVIAAGGSPVFADASPEILSPTIEMIQSVLSPRTRAIICQHTFGIPAEAEGIRRLCDEHGLFMVEDCAHVIPDERGPGNIATWGDAVIFSFGRYKIISGMAGGAVICRKPGFAETIREIQRIRAIELPLSIPLRLLLNPVVFFPLRPFISFSYVRIFIWLLVKWRILITGATPEERNGTVSANVYRMPNSCAFLVLQQWRQLHELNDHRRSLAEYYLKESKKNGWDIPAGIHPDLPLQKFPLFIGGAEDIRIVLRKRYNIHLYDGSWARCIRRSGDHLIVTSFHHADLLPETEGEQIVTLPIHPTMKPRHARYLMRCLKTVINGSAHEPRRYKNTSYPRFHIYGI